VCHDMASPTDYRKLAHPRLGMYFTGEHQGVSLVLPAAQCACMLSYVSLVSGAFVIMAGAWRTVSCAQSLHLELSQATVEADCHHGCRQRSG
jgi:hypothetical protein